MGPCGLWSVTGSPTGLPMRPAGQRPVAAVEAVALSADGTWVAGATGSTVRVWQVSDGVLTAEVDAGSAATAIDFAPDGRRLVIGDAVGSLKVAPLGGTVAEGRSAAGAPIHGLDFAPDGATIATGDDAGHVQLWRAATVSPLGPPATVPAPVRWLGFSPDAGTLFVATDHWLHRYRVGATGLEALDARLPDLRLAKAAFVSLDQSRLRMAGFDGEGGLRLEDVDFSTRPAAAEPARVGLDRNWSAVFGVRVDEAGNVVAVDP